MSTVISVEKLSKTYHLGQIGTGTFTNDLKVWWARTRGKPNPLLKIGQTDHRNQAGNELWALKDVSFTVEQGEVLGIIGRNGAGKSTLLKILSRVTAPTSGVVKVKGRIASLLEVGTGFHPELTGRENIYLNGAILGMTKQEVTRKFDEIVDFSEVGKFIDTPVKRYSSGMYVRLAFAVAAHLDPEILIVDEVLAVGDAEFQKKCLGKMGDVAREGRTVLFVSHNMASILALSSQGLLLIDGFIGKMGEISDVISYYLDGFYADNNVPLNQRTDRSGDQSITLDFLKISNDRGQNAIKCGDKLKIEIGYIRKKLVQPKFMIGIYDDFQRPIFFLDNEVSGNVFTDLPLRGSVVCHTAPINLSPGMCHVNLAITNLGSIADHIINAGSFNVESDDFFQTGKMNSRQISLCLLKNRWEKSK